MSRPDSDHREWIIELERPTDVEERELLLDRAMGADRLLKSSELLRHGRMPSPGLAFVARTPSGRLIGTVRLWDVLAGGVPTLLLGPLAVDLTASGKGVGADLMRSALARARELGHMSIVLVGDRGYYERFGFSRARTGTLWMPGGGDQSRLMTLELQPGSLAQAVGLITTPDTSMLLAA